MTPKSRDDQLIHSRRSRSVWGDFPDDPTWQRLRAPLARAHTFYVSMLYQDLGHQLYLGGYQPDDTFRVEVLGDDTERVRSVLSEALGGRSHWDMVRAVRDFFQHTGRTMLLCGSATYEIDYLADPGSLQAERFRFAEIPPGTVETRGGQRHQYVPAGVVSAEPTWLELDPATIVQFAIERSAWAELDHALDALVELASANTSAAELLIEAYQIDLPFDSGLQHKLIEHAVAAVTRPLGWDARQSLLFQWPEPLLLWRALRFRRFTIVLRNQIHDRINEALERIGQRLGLDAQLAFRGLPSLDDIDEALGDVTTGRRPYGELWELARRG